MGRSAYLLVLPLLMLLTAEANGQAGLDALRTKGNISSADSAQISQWVQSRREQFTASSRASVWRSLVEEIRSELQNDDASPAFRQALADAALRDFVLPVQSDRVGQVAQLAVLAEKAANRASLDVVLSAAESPISAVRAAVAASLRSRTLRDPLSSTEELRKVQELASKETHRLAARDFAAALAGSSNARTRFGTIASVLEARWNRSRQGEALDVHADILLARQIESLIGQGVASNDRTTAGRALGGRIAALGQRYLGETAEYWPDRFRADVEIALVLLERALSRVLAAAGQQNLPDYSTPLQNGDLDGFRTEFEKWVGTSDQPGVLNAQPWNLPVPGN